MNFNTPAFLLTHGLVPCPSEATGYAHYISQQLIGDGTIDLFVAKLTKDTDAFRVTLDEYHTWRKRRAEKCNKITWCIGLWQLVCQENCPVVLHVDLDIQSFYFGLQRCIAGLPDPPHTPSGFENIEAFKVFAQREKRLVELLFSLQFGADRSNAEVVEKIRGIVW